MPKKKREILLIAGAGNFIGRRSALMALEQGRYKVIAADRPGTELSFLEKLGAEIRIGDPCSYTECSEMLKGADLVLDATSEYDLSLPHKAMMLANFEPARTMAGVAADIGVGQYVLCSTVEVYGNPVKTPITENSRLSPENRYGLSKLRAEQACVRIGAENKMPVTILRPSIIYGPGGIHLPGILYALPYLMQEYLGFAPKPVGGPMINAVHVDDVAGALLFLVGNEKSYGRIYNVSDNDWLSLGEFIEKLWEPTGIKWRLKVPVTKLPLKLASIFGNILIPDFALNLFNSALAGQWKKVVSSKGIKPTLDPRIDRGLFGYASGDHIYDNSKIRNLGYELAFPEFDKGYLETINWMKQNQWVPSA